MNIRRLSKDTRDKRRGDYVITNTPEKAMEAARIYLKNPTPENLDSFEAVLLPLIRPLTSGYHMDNLHEMLPSIDPESNSTIVYRW